MIRRAGSRWRLLVHEILPGGGSGDAHHIGSHESGPDTAVEHGGRVFRSTRTRLEGTDFDELVVGRWLHVEQMSTGLWWLNVGGVVVHVRADRDGRPVSVDVAGPGEDDDPVPGVRYGGRVADPAG